MFERFFDETGGMQLIGHAPLGARVNRALGLGLRKKFCLNFDFELQAAASNDAVLRSLGPQHSFPLEDVPVSCAPTMSRRRCPRRSSVAPCSSRGGGGTSTGRWLCCAARAGA